MEYKFVELLSCQFQVSSEEHIRQQVTYRYNAVKSRLALMQARLADINALVSSVTVDCTFCLLLIAMLKCRHCNDCIVCCQSYVASSVQFLQPEVHRHHTHGQPWYAFCDTCSQLFHMTLTAICAIPSSRLQRLVCCYSLHVFVAWES